MKKRTLFATLTALTLTASVFAGCGNSADAVPASNMTNETGSALEDDESLKDNDSEKKQADSDQKDTKTLPAVEKNTDEKEAKPGSRDTTPAEAPAKPADTGAKSDGNGNAGNTQARPDTITGSKPSGGNSNSGNSGSGSTGSSGNSGSAPEAQPEAPAHEHVWHEHTATKQEWAPNIVVVDDYETQQVEVGCNIQCNCGAILTTATELEEHGLAHILAGEDTGHWTVPIYEEQQVKVGSHEEDHGHYETVTYVDYYYCDCGATK